MKETVVYMFIDALGYEIAQEYGFLKNILVHREKVKMQFGYSSTAIPTILSGKYPREHGHFSFFYYDPKNSPFKAFKYVKYFFGAGLSPKCILNRGRVRHLISKLTAKIMGYTGYFQLYNVPYDRLPLFDYCEKSDIFAAGGLAPVKNLRDILSESKLNFHISDWRKTESENIDAATAAISAGNIDFAFIYTAAFDSFLHDKISDPSMIASKLQSYAQKVGKVLDALKKSKRPYRFTIISDHGMTPLRGVCDIKKYLSATELKFGIDYVSMLDSTMARFWYLKPEARAKIRAALAEVKGKFLSDEEKSTYGIDFAGDKFGEDIFLMNSGIQIAPSDMGLKPLAGMHGFSPEAPESYACILSDTPLKFKPAQVKDFFDLMQSDIAELSK